MEILFENPIIIAALIGLISTIFTKQKKEEEKRRKPAQRPVNRPTLPQQPAQASSYEEQKETLEQRAKRAAAQIGQQKEKLENRAKRAAAQLEQQYAETKQKTEEELKTLNQRQRAAQQQTESIRGRLSVHNAPAAAKSQSFVPDKKKLADAVIWSEILGPPRAMNPHRSVKRKNNS